MDHQFAVLDGAAGQDHPGRKKGQKVAAHLAILVGPLHGGIGQIFQKPFGLQVGHGAVGQHQLVPLGNTIQKDHCQVGGKLLTEEFVALIGGGGLIAESKGYVFVTGQFLTQSDSHSYRGGGAVEIKRVPATFHHTKGKNA